MSIDSVYYILQWVNIVAVLTALIMSLLTFRKFTGVIGTALMYLGTGVVLTAFVVVLDLLRKTVDFISLDKISLDYIDAVHSIFITIAFCSIALGFYKLSKIYQRI